MADKPEPRLFEAMMTIKKFFDEHAEQEGDKYTMNLKEFTNMLRKDGDKRTQEEIKRIIKENDHDEDSKINFEEYQAYLFGLKKPGKPV